MEFIIFVVIGAIVFLNVKIGHIIKYNKWSIGRSLVKLLCAKADKESVEFDSDSISLYSNILRLSPDKSEVVCKLNRGIYAGENLPDGQRLTLVDAFHIPFDQRQFVERLIYDYENWPQGVEYSYTQGKDLDIHISMYVEIDYENKPFDDLDAYISYASDLQRELHLKYNRFRETNELV